MKNKEQEIKSICFDLLFEAVKNNEKLPDEYNLAKAAEKIFKARFKEEMLQDIIDGIPKSSCIVDALVAFHPDEVRALAERNIDTNVHSWDCRKIIEDFKKLISAPGEEGINV